LKVSPYVLALDTRVQIGFPDPATWMHWR
jgi:hypothetical protein